MYRRSIIVSADRLFSVSRAQQKDIGPIVVDHVRTINELARVHSAPPQSRDLCNGPRARSSRTNLRIGSTARNAIDISTQVGCIGEHGHAIGILGNGDITHYTAGGLEGLLYHSCFSIDQIDHMPFTRRLAITGCWIAVFAGVISAPHD
ncbi:hypothetical protein D3C84_929860 [compost metagenome]